MGWSSRSGRARTSATNPQAHAICDRCGFRYNHIDLRWQYDWRGTSLQNIRILVCNSCYDEPQQQLRAIVIPADPVPISNPRIENFAVAETNTRFTSGQNSVDPVTSIPIIGGDTRITEDDNTRVTQQTGGANGSLNQEPGTDPNAPGNDDPGLPINTNEVPKTGNLSPPLTVIWYNGVQIEVNWLNTGGVPVNWQTP